MYTGLTFATISRGAGVHQWDVAAHRIVSFRKLAYAQATLFLPVIFPVKCTIFLQYIRIFTPTRTGKTYKLILFVLWFNLVAYLPIQFVSFCVCVPLRKAWMPESVEGHCVNQKANFLASAVINVILDLSILVLPMWCIWRLRMPIKRKFGISAVFGVGFL
ncbi:MAG: hypothetical protein M1833_005288 [Piccolia ochrophora]|nr:MAG: hypothetical protein M1833_005288 [Piccolia ochrophora]